LYVYYNIESEAEATLGMMKAFREWEERSCLKFKRRENETTIFANVYPKSTCFAELSPIFAEFIFEDFPVI